VPIELDLALRIGIPVLLVALGFFWGSFVERRHYASIERRERERRPIPVTNVRELDEGRHVASSRLVSASVVVSVDAFKAMVGSIQIFFGGRVRAYESLVDRARREAILRLFDEAGAVDTLVNLRVETSMIDQDEPGKNATSIEALAYATAVEYES
jgi:uncharacterized protein YbjQ (UPF0145 family)